MAKKAVPIILMIVGTAILIGIGLFALDNVTSAKPEGLGTWISTVLGLVLGAAAGIKGWMDLSKKDTPSQETKNIALDGGQLATGDQGRNIQTKGSSQYLEQNIQNYYEAPKTEALARQSNIEVGSIDVGGNVGDNLIVGNGNIINLPPKE